MELKKIRNAFPEISKTSIAQKAAEDAKKLIESAELAPLTAYVFVKALEEYAKNVQALLKADAMQEAEMFRGEKKFTIAGAAVEFTRTAPRWDYSHDWQWAKLDKEIKELKTKQKEREALLKHLSKPMFDIESGEEIKPAKKISGGEETIKITIPNVGK